MLKKMPYWDPETSDPFEIIVGTYEQYLLGYRVHSVVNEYKMEKSFATHCHVASIRSIASARHYLASASADDTVCLYDMHHRIESGKLMHHNDTINCIVFTPEASHLFTCSKDGSIAAIRCGNWQIEKHWLQAHKGSAVNTLAIHPTGKLALSTGTDGILRTWNLIKGRQAYAINLISKFKYDAKNIMIIKWSPNGEKYLLAVNQKINVYSVEVGGLEKEFTFNSKVICVEFLKDNLIAAGFEDGQIKFCDLRSSRLILETAAHNIRVKCITHMNDLLVSASSMGEIKLWKYNKHSLNMLQTVNCGARITCLSLALPCKNLMQQKEKESEEKKEIKTKSNLRLKQEVIIEEEGEWECTDVASSKIEATNLKRKKKRVINAEGSNQTLKKKMVKLKETDISKKKRAKSLVKDDIDRPNKKKKMLLKSNEANVFGKKRKQHNAVSEITLPTKKIKGTSKVEPSITCKKHKKHKLPVTINVEDAPPRKKKKKKINSLKEDVPKRKKRKAIEIN